MNADVFVKGLDYGTPLHRVIIQLIVANRSVLFWRAHTELHARTVSTIWCVERVYRQHIRATADPNDGLTRVSGGVFFLRALVCLGAKGVDDACCGFVLPVRFGVVPCDWHALILSRAEMAEYDYISDFRGIGQRGLLVANCPHHPLYLGTGGVSSNQGWQVQFSSLEEMRFG